MSTVRENILANIKTTLDGITVANGYVNTLAKVERWKQHGNSVKSVPCVFITAGPEDQEPTPNPYVTCKLTVYLEVWMRQEESDTAPSDSYLNSLLGDIEKSLAVDVTRGNYAKDTNLKNSIPFETVEGQANMGLNIELEIVYQYKQGDPTSSG